MLDENELKKINDALKNRATVNMLSEMRKDLEQRIDKIMDEIDKKNEDKDLKIEELRKELTKIKKELETLEQKEKNIEISLSSLRSYTLKYEKLNKRLRGIEEVIGVEEDINVNKIPPSILRLVYQYTLNDAIYELRKYVGYEQAETIIKEVLQDVRTKTSGTELFKFSQGKIEARDIEKAIERKLISPKQIHLTYIEIVKKIKEYLPGYTPKNFASLLRTKGQEYAIETSTENRLRIEMLERHLESARNEMAYQENVLREDITEIKRMMDQDMQENMKKVNEKFEDVLRRIEKVNEDVARIYEDISRISPYLNMFIKSVFKEIEDKIPPEGIKRDELEFPPKIIDDFLNERIPQGQIIVKDDVIYLIEKVKDKIINTIGDDFISFSELKKRTGYDKDILITVLEIMKNEETIKERKYGKGKKYKRR
ncbi:MAG: hypothetical protein GXO25_07750 [Euryarchaeota archaeon]|nr:hypothetical protein [Euryarchaeota archaeon]